MKLFPAVLALSLAAASASAAAQDYPTRPIRMVVPYSPGFITDLAARLVAQRMSPLLGQQIVIENRAGAGTRIGMQFVASAAPDGYTLLFANSVTHGTMPAMAKSLPFDPIKDFAPVAPLFWYASTLVCHPSTPANTVKELVAYAKKNPGKLTYATAGPGSGHHLAGALLNSMAGIDIVHVHYKGGAPAIQDVFAGNVNCTWDGAAKPNVESGKVKALGTTGSRPDPRLPNVPTISDAGVKGFDVTWWQGIVAPAGTSREIIAKLNAAANEAIKDGELQKRAYDMSLNISGGSPEDLAKLIRNDMAKFARIVEEAKIPRE